MCAKCMLRRVGLREALRRHLEHVDALIERALPQGPRQQEALGVLYQARCEALCALDICELHIRELEATAHEWPKEDFAEA